MPVFITSDATRPSANARSAFSCASLSMRGSGSAPSRMNTSAISTRMGSVKLRVINNPMMPPGIVTLREPIAPLRNWNPVSFSSVSARSLRSVAVISRFAEPPVLMLDIESSFTYSLSA
jgi:hypothetical protein